METKAWFCVNESGKRVARRPSETSVKGWTTLEPRHGGRPVLTHRDHSDPVPSKSEVVMTGAMADYEDALKRAYKDVSSPATWKLRKNLRLEVADRDVRRCCWPGATTCRSGGEFRTTFLAASRLDRLTTILEDLRSSNQGGDMPSRPNEVENPSSFLFHVGYVAGKEMMLLRCFAVGLSENSRRCVDIYMEYILRASHAAAGSSCRWVLT